MVKADVSRQLLFDKLALAALHFRTILCTEEESSIGLMISVIQVKSRVGFETSHGGNTI